MATSSNDITTPKVEAAPATATASGTETAAAAAPVLRFQPAHDNPADLKKFLVQVADRYNAVRSEENKKRKIEAISKEGKTDDQKTENALSETCQTLSKSNEGLKEENKQLKEGIAKVKEALEADGKPKGQEETKEPAADNGAAAVEAQAQAQLAAAAEQEQRQQTLQALAMNPGLLQQLPLPERVSSKIVSC